MPENIENVAINAQENSEKSENIQQNTEENTELNNNESEIEADATEVGEKSENSEDDELPLPEPDLPQDEKKKKELPEWMKRKLDREKRKEAERVAAEENERLRLQGATPANPANAANPANVPNQQPVFDPFMPRREQFNSEGEYFLALGDYRDAKRQAEFTQAQRVKQFKEQEQRFQNALKETVEEGKTKYKDFEEKVDYIMYGEGFPSNRGMAEAIVDSKYRDDILYFLGSNEKEAVRIANLNPVAAAKEIAKIEVRFDAKRKSNVTKAPNPLAPVSGGNKGTATHKDPNKMDPQEFRTWYESTYGR